MSQSVSVTLTHFSAPKLQYSEDTVLGILHSVRFYMDTSRPPFPTCISSLSLPTLFFLTPVSVNGVRILEGECHLRRGSVSAGRPRPRPGTVCPGPAIAPAVATGTGLASVAIGSSLAVTCPVDPAPTTTPVNTSASHSTAGPHIEPHVRPRVSAVRPSVLGRGGTGGVTPHVPHVRPSVRILSFHVFSYS